MLADAVASSVAAGVECGGVDVAQAASTVLIKTNKLAKTMDILIFTPLGR
jgi:hypothetical protein